MAGLMLPALQELTALLDRALAESAPRDLQHEDAILSAANATLSGLSDRLYATDKPEVTLKLHGVRRALGVPKSQVFLVLVPLVVEYTGTASGEEWAVAEKKLEAEIQGALAGAAGSFWQAPSVKLLKRRKSKPFEEGSPLSLTILRYRVGRE